MIGICCLVVSALSRTCGSGVQLPFSSSDGIAQWLEQQALRRFKSYSFPTRRIAQLVERWTSNPLKNEAGPFQKGLEESSEAKPACVARSMRTRATCTEP